MISGYFLDGEWAMMRGATAALEGSPENGTWVFTEVGTGTELARWPAADVIRKPSRKGQMRLSASSAPLGARFVLSDRDVMDEAERIMPSLVRQRRQQRGRKARLLTASTALLAGVVAAYIWGIPLIAGPIAGAIPSEWESELGRSAAVQVETSLGDGDRMLPCDPDPESAANLAISRLVARALGDRAAPFPVRVMVGHSEVPNAFAIPGGQVYYTSSLLDATESGDEFAGVLVHEVGHVMYRHTMQNIVTAAGTGLIVGFILGDMTGLSVAGGLGTMIIDNNNNRAAEREADLFAAEAARRLGYAPTALGDLLERVAEDQSGDAVFALLSSHPLTAERKQTLAALSADATVSATAFTPAEWQAVKSMCGARKDGAGAGVKPGSGSGDR